MNCKCVFTLHFQIVPIALRIFLKKVKGYTTQLVVEQTHCGRRYVCRVQSLFLPVTSRLPTHTHTILLSIALQALARLEKGKTSATKMRACSSIYSASRVYWWIGRKNLLWSLGDGAEGNKQHSGTLVGKLSSSSYFLICAGWPNNKPKPPSLRCACVLCCAAIPASIFLSVSCFLSHVTLASGCTQSIHYNSWNLIRFTGNFVNLVLQRSFSFCDGPLSMSSQSFNRSHEVLSSARFFLPYIYALPLVIGRLSK